MTDESDKDSGLESEVSGRGKPPPEAERALAEAAARRADADAEAGARPTERQGRGGLDPARYGDWEVKGIASDF